MRRGTVWLVEKKIVRHVLDMGFEHVEIPVRVKFEFEVKEGVFVTTCQCHLCILDLHQL
jgi:hypothetical protein